MYQRGTDLESLGWWNRLSEDERRQAEAEARQYEVFSEEARAFCKPSQRREIESLRAIIRDSPDSSQLASVLHGNEPVVGPVSTRCPHL